MLCELRPCFRNLCRSAKRNADLEHCGRLNEEDRGLSRPCDGRGGHGRGRAAGAGRPGSLLTNWVVVSERTVDENGSHSWSLLSGPPSDEPWLPSDLYRFEGSSFSMDLPAEAPPTPEASTWVMMLIGFAGLGIAGHRSSKNPGARSNFPRGKLRDDLQSAATKISSDRADAGVDPKSTQQRPRNSGRRSGIDERRKRRTNPEAPDAGGRGAGTATKSRRSEG